MSRLRLTFAGVWNKLTYHFSRCQGGFNPSVSGNNRSDEMLILGASLKLFFFFPATFQREVRLSGTLWFLICSVFTLALGLRGANNPTGPHAKVEPVFGVAHTWWESHHVQCSFIAFGEMGLRGFFLECQRSNKSKCRKAWLHGRLINLQSWNFTGY